jgi:hypothetical protein
MKKLLWVIILGLLLSSNAYAGKQDMISALKGIPVVADALWKDDISLEVSMHNPNIGHNFDELGSIICNGGVSKFLVKKGYTVTFWDPYVPRQITKFRCY